MIKSPTGRKKEEAGAKDGAGSYVKERKLTASLEQANDELRDAYMSYKEIASRCTIDFEATRSSREEEAEERGETADGGLSSVQAVGRGPRARRQPTTVYYFKPDSVLMAHPDAQKNYREKLLQQIKAVPEISVPRLMAEDLQESLIESVADRSDPREMRKVLANYYQRKQYCLQHKRYKLLLRWAHHAVRTRNIETIGQQATFRCSKMQGEIDNAIKRYQRLELDDDYTLGLHPELRPTSKAKKSGGTLYVELKDLPAQSSIRADDIEVFLRHTAYSNKINKLVNKFMAKLKWLPISDRFEIFDGAVDSYFRMRAANIEGQNELVEELQRATRENSIESRGLLEDLYKLKHSAHITKYQKSMVGLKQRITGSCRPDYDVAPDLINNVPEAKHKIVALAKLFGLTAGLEQDNGFSFAYQLSLFFPTHLQKQIIKSQFSIYDAFAGQRRDKAQLKKRNLQSMLRVDPNIFKDVSTNAALVPTEESLTDEVVRLNLKIIRLKASPWVEHIISTPKVEDWQRKQDAILYSESNPIDTLLSGALDFLDVNDLASVNLVIAESSQVHLDLIWKQQVFEEQSNMSKVSKRVEVQVPVGEQTHQEEKKNLDKHDKDSKNQANEETIYQTVSATSIHETNNNLYVQMSNALTGNTLRSGQMQSPQRARHPKSSIFNLPIHLVQSHNTLRYMQSRDNKIKMLYSLNYFRSMQKRLMLDLREFGTRERVLGDVTDPLIPPEEAEAQIVDTLNMMLSNTNQAMRAAEQRKLQEEMEESETGSSPGKQSKPLSHAADAQYAIIDQARIEELERRKDTSGVALVDLKCTRFKGKFHEKHLSTCPVMPRFHSAFGEPSEVTGEFVEKEKPTEFISKESMKMMNRIDHVEIDERQQEVFVKDDFNIYIMYECALTDMQLLEQELLRVGSFYISRLEELYDSEVDKVIHKKDRQQVINDLLACETRFQFKKVLLTQLYMECYEHICDPVEQQRLIQLIIDTMARRPRLALDALYFKDSYNAEIECIDRTIELLDLVIQNQMALEKQENTNLHESLNLSYSLASSKAKEGWKYHDADAYLQGLIDKFKIQRNHEMYSQQVDDRVQAEKSNSRLAGLQKGMLLSSGPPVAGPAGSGSPNVAKEQSASKPADDQSDEATHGLRYGDSELDSDAFTKLLGLPKITLEHLFQQSRENDEVIQDIMAEQSHFVNLLEGYPDLMTLKQSGTALGSRQRSTLADDSLGHTQAATVETERARPRVATLPDEVAEINIKFNSWLKRSDAMSIMDFYSDSMSCVTKLTATLKSCNQELVEVLKPHDNMMSSLLEAEILRAAIKQYRQMQNFLLGEETETQGHQYIEDESIAGSSDRMMFYTKQLSQELFKSKKASLNPFFVSKLDLPSIKLYNYPKNVKADENLYQQQHDGLQEGKSVNIAIAEAKFSDPGLFRRQVINSFEGSPSGNSTDTSKSKVYSPPLLKLHCNTVELLRLRQELMMCLSECAVLQELFRKQAVVCNQPTQTVYGECLAFEHGLAEDNEINFIDDGPARRLGVQLAISEVDPIITSNLNFRNSDAFKMMIMSSGLEEIRTILHYQMMQKQALIVATRCNQVLMDTHLRAQRELELVEAGRALPNMVVCLSHLLSRSSDGIDIGRYRKIKSAYSMNLANQVSQSLVSVKSWKGVLRTHLGKYYQRMVTECEQKLAHDKPEVKLRILRSFKVSLFNQYCNQVLRDVWVDSLKYNMVAQCQKLRTLNQYFQFNLKAMNIEPKESDSLGPKFSQLFDLESSDLFENFFDAYRPGRFEEELQKRQDATNASASRAKIETVDWKEKEQLDIFSIPSSCNLMAMDVLSPQESSKMKLGCGFEDLKFDLTNPDVEGAFLYDQVLPNLKIILPDHHQNDKHLAPRRKALNFNDLLAAQMFRYYHFVESITTLELSVAKYAFSSSQMIEMDHAIDCGLPFYYGGQENYGFGEDTITTAAMHDVTAIIGSGRAAPDMDMTNTGKRIQDSQKLSSESDGRNETATRILRNMHQKKKMKSDIGEELYEVATKVRAVLFEAKKHGERTSEQASFHSEYLQQYQEIRYLQVVANFARMIEHYARKGQDGAAQAVNDAVFALAKRDHIKVLSSNGIFHLNSIDLDLSSTTIEPSSFVLHFGSISERRAFKRTIQPILSDRALEPQEITLLESIYLNNSTLVPQTGEDTAFSSQPRGQFAGCCFSSSPIVKSDLRPMSTHLLCLNDKTRQAISDNMKNMELMLHDYLELIIQENIKPSQKVYSFTHLKKSRRFLTDQIESRQMKHAMMCFMAHQVPQKVLNDKQLRKQMEDMFSKQLLWKILEEKDVLKEAQEARFRSSASTDSMVKIQQRFEAEIQKLKATDERKITDVEVSNAHKLQIQALMAEQKEMQRKLLLDHILTSRAEIQILQVEIERNLITSAVRTLDSETNALANCLKNESKELDAFIHPFQQFAVTLYDRVDPLSHLDAINKVSHIQQFMTRLKNRGTEVETLTSGPGYVFTLKDINDCVGTLSKGLIKYSEQEMRTRCEMAAKKEQHLLDMLYCKDQKIDSLERRLEEQVAIIDKMVNSRMYEKGNQIVYELDQANRSLKLLKDNIYLMETNIRKDVEAQFKNKLLHRENSLDKERRKFGEFKENVVATWNAGIARESDKVNAVISKMPAKYRENLDGPSPAKYPLPRETDGKTSVLPRKMATRLGAQLASQFQSQGVMDHAPAPTSHGQHHGHHGRQNPQPGMPSSVYSSVPRDFPGPLREAYLLSEQEAREELVHLHDKYRKLFIFNKVKEVTMKQNFQNQIQELNAKLSSNSMLWEQMAEAEKREHVLRQELVLTQQSLSNSEKVVEKLREQIKRMETEKMRLQQFKANKGKRLEELEQKVTQYQIFEKVNVEKLIVVLKKQQDNIASLQTDNANFSRKIEHSQRRNHEELREIHRKFTEENELKNRAIAQMDAMRQEIEELERTGSASSVWKDKCKEVYEICQNLKEDNEYISDRCRQIADVAVNLAEKYQQEQASTGLQSLRGADRTNIGNQAPDFAPRQGMGMSLPKLSAQHDDSFFSLGPSTSQKRSTKFANNKLLEASDQAAGQNFGFQLSKSQQKMQKSGNRGRSLFEIKQAFERPQENHLDQVASNNVETTADLSPGTFNAGSASHNISKALSLSKELKDSLLQTSQQESLLGSAQPAGKSGIAFASSSIADHRRSKGERHHLQMSSEAYFSGSSGHQDLASQFKKQLQRNKLAVAATRSSIVDQQQSFYNMKAQLGMQSLYSSNQLQQPRKTASRTGHRQGAQSSGRALLEAEQGLVVRGRPKPSRTLRGEEAGHFHHQAPVTEYEAKVEHREDDRRVPKNSFVISGVGLAQSARIGDGQTMEKYSAKPSVVGDSAREAVRQAHERASVDAPDYSRHTPTPPTPKQQQTETNNF